MDLSREAGQKNSASPGNTRRNSRDRVFQKGSSSRDPRDGTAQLSCSAQSPTGGVHGATVLLRTSCSVIRPNVSLRVRTNLNQALQLREDAPYPTSTAPHLSSLRPSRNARLAHRHAVGTTVPYHLDRRRFGQLSPSPRLSCFASPRHGSPPLCSARPECLLPARLGLLRFRNAPRRHVRWKLPLSGSTSLSAASLPAPGRLWASLDASCLWKREAGARPARPGPPSKAVRRSPGGQSPSPVDV